MFKVTFNPNNYMIVWFSVIQISLSGLLPVFRSPSCLHVGKSKLHLFLGIHNLQHTTWFSGRGGREKKGLKWIWLGSEAVFHIQLATWPCCQLPVLVASQRKYTIWKFIFGAWIHLQVAGMNLKRECLQCPSGSSAVTHCISPDQNLFGRKRQETHLLFFYWNHIC